MSAEPFLICGLPRSRTAWLANLLSYDGAACEHELMAKYSTPEVLAHALTSRQMAYSGNSDTYQCLHIDALRKAMPGVRVAAIMRPLPEVIRSLDQLGFPCTEEQLQPFATAMDRIAEMPDVMTVNFDDLRDEGACAALVQHLTPNVWWDYRRWALLDSLNIQISKERWSELFNLAKLHVLEN